MMVHGMKALLVALFVVVSCCTGAKVLVKKELFGSTYMNVNATHDT